MGNAVIVLHSMFRLRPGTTVPLLRGENTRKVKPGGGEPIEIDNGHAII
jgi:hypothetical protein